MVEMPHHQCPQLPCHTTSFFLAVSVTSCSERNHIDNLMMTSTTDQLINICHHCLNELEPKLCRKVRAQDTTHLELLVYIYIYINTILKTIITLARKYENPQPP